MLTNFFQNVLTFLPIWGQNKFSHNTIGKLKKIHLELLIKMHDSMK